MNGRQQLVCLLAAHARGSQIANTEFSAAAGPSAKAQQLARPAKLLASIQSPELCRSILKLVAIGHSDAKDSYLR